MLLFEGHGIEVEKPTFALGVRFPLSTKGLLKFPTQGGSSTGLELRTPESRFVLLFLHLKFGADHCQPLMSPGEDGKHQLNDLHF